MKSRNIKVGKAQELRIHPKLDKGEKRRQKFPHWGEWGNRDNGCRPRKRDIRRVKNGWR